MAISSTNKQFHKILALLGIDVKDTKRVVITANMDETVVVEIEKYVNLPNDTIIETQLFHLVSVEDEDEDGNGLNIETKE